MITIINSERKKRRLFLFNRLAFTFRFEPSIVKRQTMPHYKCPCGYRFDRASDGRSCGSLRLQLFISIRTMVTVFHDSRICGACQESFYTWKKTNPHLERMLKGIEMGEDSVADSESEVITDSYINEPTMQSFLSYFLSSSTGRSCDGQWR